MGGLGAGVTLWKRQVRALRLLGAAILLAAAAIWGFTTFQGYWHHMAPPEPQQSKAIRIQIGTRVEVAARRSAPSQDSALPLGQPINHQ